MTEPQDREDKIPPPDSKKPDKFEFFDEYEAFYRIAYERRLRKTRDEITTLEQSPDDKDKEKLEEARERLKVLEEVKDLKVENTDYSGTKYTIAGTIDGKNVLIEGSISSVNLPKVTGAFIDFEEQPQSEAERLNSRYWEVLHELRITTTFIMRPDLIPGPSSTEPKKE